MTKPHDPAALETIIERLFAHVGATDSRLRELVACVPQPYVRIMAELLCKTEKETNGLAFQLVKELHDQGLITREPAPVGRS